MLCLIFCIFREALAPYHKQIFILLFQRLSSSKTTKYVIGLIVFFNLYAVKFSGNELVSTIDGIQAKYVLISVLILFMLSVVTV